MKKLLIFPVLLTALFLSACDGISITIGGKSTPEPPAAQPRAPVAPAARTQQPADIPRTERSLIPPASTPVSPGGAPPQASQRSDAVIRSDVFTLNTRELTNLYTLPGNNTGQLWRITAEMAPGQGERTLKVEAPGTIQEGVSVSIYKLANDRMPGGEEPLAVLTGFSQPKNVYMRSYDYLYIRAVNSQTSPRNVTVKVTEELELVISPPAVTLAAGGRQEFTATWKGTSVSPPVTWSVAEGAAGGSIRDGFYTAPHQAGTYHVVAETKGEATFIKRVSATITVPLSAAPPVAKPAPASTPLKGGSRGSFTITQTYVNPRFGDRVVTISGELSSDYVVVAPKPASGAFPGAPFNGLQITSFSLTGAQLDAPMDPPSGYTVSRQYKGRLTGNTLTLSGTTTELNGNCNTDFGSFKVRLDASLTLNGVTKEYHSPEPCTQPAGAPKYIVNQGSGKFSLTVTGQ